MSNGFTLLWNKILQSSIWDEDLATRVVWITLLALKNADGLVISTFNALHRAANVSPEQCRVALEKFLAPDPLSHTTSNEGRRIKKVDGGWLILNHEKYRYSTEEKRVYWREQKKRQRRKVKPKPVSQDYKAKEKRFEAAHGDGDDQKCDEISDPDYGLHEEAPPYGAGI